MLPPITDSVSECIGSTPMVKLTSKNKGNFKLHLKHSRSFSLTLYRYGSVNILAKLEFTNPTGSGKDRLAKYLLDGNKSYAKSPQNTCAFYLYIYL